MDYIIANKEKIINKILSRCDKIGECLVWNGFKFNGYGKITIKNKPYLVHRIMLILNGNVTNYEKLHALHMPIICHNPSCCNYKHLRWGTCQENANDKIFDETNTNGEKSGMSKLLNSDVINIFNSHERNKDLILKYKISNSVISQIKHGKAWTHLTLKSPPPSKTPYIFSESMTIKQIHSKRLTMKRKHLKLMKSMLDDLLKEYPSLL